MEETMEDQTSSFCSAIGNVHNKREVGGFIVEVIQYAPGKIIPRHTHLMPVVGVFLSGECRETSNKQEVTFRHGTALFQRDDDVHSDLFCACTEVVGIGISEAARARLADGEIYFDNTVVARSGFFALLAHKIASNIRLDEFASELIVEGAVLELIGGLFQRPSHKGGSWYVSRAENILKDTFIEPFSLDNLAKEVGVHPVQLAREFRRVHRLTIGEYIRKLRIEYVCAKLKSSSISLRELAQESGFTDHSHLTRTFKAHMGLSPGEFRTTTRSSRKIQTSSFVAHMDPD
jgi:AraC family transcriptional regulator